MRIAVNTRFLIKNKLEGIGWFTYETMKRIAQNHPEHEFIFLFDRPFSEEFIFAKNVTPVVLSPPARHPLLWYIWFEWVVPRALKKYKADVFISPDGFTSLRSRKKNLVVIHDIAFEHFNDQATSTAVKYLRHYTKQYVLHATRIATVSEYTKKDLVSYYKVHPGKIDVVYNGSNQHYKPLSENEKLQTRKKITDGKNFFVFVSAIQPRKNVSRIFQAFDQFKDQTQSNVKLVIAGRKAWKYDEIFKTYEAMKYKDDVVFLGHLSQVDLANVVGTATALLYPSLFEGFGIPIVEAMNADVPVITSNVSSMPEVAGDAALLIDPQSIEQLSSAMQKLYVDENLRNSLISRGRVQREKFNWDRTAETLWLSIERMIQS